jgi:hypothetical protein
MLEDLWQMAEIDRFVEVYVGALRDENAAVFAGAGLSIPAGLVDWRGLMRSIAEDIGLSVDQEEDLLSIAQYHVNERGGRNGINQGLITKFGELAQTTENHKILARLPIQTYWTTNYDTLIEDSLRRQLRRVDVKISQANLATTLPRRDATVYKMHGDISQPQDAVVTRDDYERYQATHPLFASALQGDLVEKTFLFIGFSFNDPNLAWVLSRIRLLVGENRRDHYALLRRVQRADFANDADYLYASARQDLQVRDLRRYGIHGLLVDSYAEFTEVLRRVAARFLRRRVFISGSAVTYAPFTELDGQELLRRLGTGLIEQGLDVVTGFGLGVGPYLLNGVLEGLEATGTQSLHDRVTLRPFPQGIADPVVRATRWLAYRRDMIAHAGMGIFVFGNRDVIAGEPELAQGVEEEFEIARAAGLLLVPVGATGYMARRLHEKVMVNFDALYPNRPEWREPLSALGQESDAASIVERTIALVVNMSREG